MQTGPHFHHPTARWAVAGATIGVAVVFAVSAVAIVFGGSDVEVMAVAGLAAAFGGTGFGAMLGAVLAEVRHPAVEIVSVREPGAEVRPRAMSS